MWKERATHCRMQCQTLHAAGEHALAGGSPSSLHQYPPESPQARQPRKGPSPAPEPAATCPKLSASLPHPPPPEQAALMNQQVCITQASEALLQSCCIGCSACTSRHAKRMLAELSLTEQREDHSSRQEIRDKSGLAHTANPRGQNHEGVQRRHTAAWSEVNHHLHVTMSHQVQEHGEGRFPHH